MTVINRTWDRLTLPGKIVFTLVPVVLAGLIALVAVIAVLGGTIVDILAANLPIVRFAVAATVILGWRLNAPSSAQSVARVAQMKVMIGPS